MAFKKRGKSNFSRSSSSHSSSSRKSSYNDQNEDLAKITKAPENPLEAATFETLPPAIVEAYQRAGWAEVMPVQAHAIPYLLEGRHMMIQSRTGSGKTGAYLLPLIEKIELDLPKAQALVLVPTRELAVQVEKEAKKLFGENIRSITLYGGVPYQKQLDALKKGAQLIIGTPGRILDHLQKGTLKLECLKALVFDEADRMLSIGFYPDMKALQEYLPKDLPEGKDILVTLFSATYPHNVLKLAKEFLKEPELLSLSQGQVHIANMQHFCVHCSKMEKDRALIRMLEIENPTSSIIFCNTKATVHYIAQVLKGFGYNAEELSSELSQSKREFVLSRLRKGDTRFVVATDVAARGIDIPMLSHVFLYEPPEDRESYIHRAGRTARAGASGTVISLADTMERLEMQKIAKFYDIEMLPYETPKEEDVARVVSQRVLAMLEQQKRNLNGLEKERVERFIELVEQLVSNENEDKENIFLLAMLLDEVYQKALNPKVEKQSHTRGRNGRNQFQKKEERSFSSDDTLDSMRDDFQAEMRAKYGPRGPRGRSGGQRERSPRPSFAENREGRENNSFDRSDRNAPWRHDKQERSFKRENSFGNEERNDSSFNENRERSFTPRGDRDNRGRGDRDNRGRDGRGRDFKRRDRNEDRNNDAFSLRKTFTSQAKNHNDDDVFFDSPRFDRNDRNDRNFRNDRNDRNDRSFRRSGNSDRQERQGNDFPRRNRSNFEDFAQNGERTPSRSRSHNEDRNDYSRKSFLPQRSKDSNNKEENFKVFEDDNFMRPLRGRGKFGSNEDRDFSRDDASKFSPRKKSSSHNKGNNKGKQKFHRKGK